MPPVVPAVRIFRLCIDVPTPSVPTNYGILQVKCLASFTICSNEFGIETGGRLVSGFVKVRFTERGILPPSASDSEHRETLSTFSE